MFVWWIFCLTVKVLKRRSVARTSKYFTLCKSNGKTFYHAPIMHLIKTPKHVVLQVNRWPQKPYLIIYYYQWCFQPLTSPLYKIRNWNLEDRVEKVCTSFSLTPNGDKDNVLRAMTVMHSHSCSNSPQAPTHIRFFSLVIFIILINHLLPIFVTIAFPLKSVQGRLSTSFKDS